MKPRLDRLLSVGLSHPISRIRSRQSSVRVPILMYHGVSDSVSNGHPYFELNTAPKLFARHMGYLRDNGYDVTDLDGAVEAIDSGRCGAKLVVITFDDAYRDFYTKAFPILQRYGFRATLFVVAGFTYDRTLLQRGHEYMTWTELREVQSAGVTIGSHTVTHPDLHTVSPEEFHYEIAGSKTILEEKLAAPVRSFSYPYAFPEQNGELLVRLRTVLRLTGYEHGVSTIIGTASRKHDAYFLPRLPVNTYDDLRLFQAKLEGGYDWLHIAQRLCKSARREPKTPRTVNAASV